jgi:hypothetical protein
MVSIGSFHGLNAAYVQQLFGIGDAAPASASPARNAASGANAGSASAGDPFAAIKAILANAQLASAQTSQPKASTASSLAEAAYAANTADAGLTASASTQVEPFQTVQSAQASMQTTQEGATLGASVGTGQVSGVIEGVGFLTKSSFSSLSETSAAGATNVDSFQETVAVGDDAVSIGFAVTGLGPLQLVDNSLTVGAGSLQDFFQIGVSAQGQYTALSFNIGGLSSQAQAQQLADAFQQALGAPGGVTVKGDSYSYEESLGSGASLDIQGIVGYN